MIHGPMNVKFINAKQGKEIHQFTNIERKLYKTNAAIWYDKTCRHIPDSVYTVFELLMKGRETA